MGTMHPDEKLPSYLPSRTSSATLKESVSSEPSTLVNDGPTLRERLRYNLDVLLPKLSFLLAAMVGSGITAGATYGLVRHVQHLIATAKVSSDPEKWMQEARTKAYEACYFGCDGCDDPSYAYKACAKTATANVTGVICDGAQMWNWKDRYPVPCLAALGEDYKHDALMALKQKYRNQLAVIILTVLAGLVGGWVFYRLWERLMVRRRRRAEEMKWTAADWPRLFGAQPWRTAKSVGRKEKRERTRKSRSVRARTAIAGLLAFGSFRKAAAYACTGYHPTFDQYFVNSNRTVFGVVHGWFSYCYDAERCTWRCIGGCEYECTTTTLAIQSPKRFVHDVIPLVTACGFHLEDAVQTNEYMRVANAGIEQNWWVKISVNGYNVTTHADTDDAVLCLHEIGNK